MRIVLALSLLMVLSGCAKVVDDFVTGGDPAITPPVIGGGSDDDGAFKITPGSVRSAGTNISMKAVITTNRHVSTGNNVSAVMGLHKSR